MTFSIGSRLIGRSVRDDLPPSIMPEWPQVGIVIGTYGSVPYVHMQLEARARLYANVPMLVHDDASVHREALSGLCRAYGADFESNSYHMPLGGLGDMTAFLGGFLWCKDKNLHLLVKFSRRFVPLVSWVDDFTATAVESEATTYSHSCISNGWGFRTECMGAHVGAWFKFGCVDDIQKNVLTHNQQFVEGYMHGLAGRMNANTSLKNCHYLDEHPEHTGLGFVPWRFMGVGRNIPDSHALWHNRNTPADYLAQAHAWGLTEYALKDFEVRPGT